MLLNWLGRGRCGPTLVRHRRGLPYAARQACLLLAADCRAQIYYLNKATQPELQRHINGLPALFLDCDDDIDLEHDTGAKARYAQQISEFSGFVRRLQARRCAPQHTVPSHNGLMFLSCLPARSIHPWVDTLLA